MHEREPRGDAPRCAWSSLPLASILPRERKRFEVRLTCALPRTEALQSKSDAPLTASRSASRPLRPCLTASRSAVGQVRPAPHPQPKPFEASRPSPARQAEAVRGKSDKPPTPTGSSSAQIRPAPHPKPKPFEASRPSPPPRAEALR